MKVTLVAVMSVNGLITDGDDTNLSKWTSAEDKTFFSSILESHNLVVMGRKTYDSARNHMKLNNEKLRIVMTRDPDKYKKEELPGVLEFTRQSPIKIIENSSDLGYSELLVLGGSAIYSEFLNNHLVDELYLTMEPKLFSHGVPIFSTSRVDTSLSLVEFSQLNKEGTLLLHYKSKEG